MLHSSQLSDGFMKKNTKYMSRVFKKIFATLLLSCVFVIPSGFPTVFKRLLKCRVYCVLVAANSFTLFGSIGLNSFGPKYMESIFNIPPWKANSILGKTIFYMLNLIIMIF